MNTKKRKTDLNVTVNWRITEGEPSPLWRSLWHRLVIDAGKKKGSGRITSYEAKRDKDG